MQQKFESSIQRSGQLVKNTFSQMQQQIGGAFGKAASGPLQTFKSQIDTLPASFNKATSGMTQMGGAAEKTTGKLAAFGEKFRSNKGMIFGIAGLSSAMAEAIGMMDMYAMAQGQVAEAQAKINELQAEGITEGKEMNDALAEQTKAEKFLSMARRNTMLSMMDNVFFSTMVISQMSQMNLKGGIVGKTFGKLTSVFKGSGAATKLVSEAAATSVPKIGAMTAASMASAGAMDVTSTSAKGLTVSLRGLAAAAALVAAPLAAAFAAFDIIPKMQKMDEADKVINDATKTIREKLEAEKSQLEQTLAPFDIVSPATWAASIARAINPEGAKDSAKKLEEINALLASGKADLEATITTPVAEIPGLINGMDELTTIQQNWAKDLAAITPQVKTFWDVYSAKLRTGTADTQQIRKEVEDWVAVMVENKKITEGQGEALLYAVNYGLDIYDEELKKNIKSEEESAKKKQDLAKKQQELVVAQREYAISSEENRQKIIETAEALVKENIALEHQFGSRAIALVAQEKDADIRERIIGLAQQAEGAMQAEEDSVAAIALQYGIANDQILDYVANSQNNIKTINDLITANLDYAKALTDTEYRAELVSTGQQQGTVKTREFLDSIIKNSAEQKRYDVLLKNTAQTLGFSFAPGLQLSTDMLEDFVTLGLDPASKALERIKTAQGAMESAFSGISGLLDAEDTKEFNKAWKELDLGSIPKSVRDDFKDMAKQFREAAEKGREVSTALNLVTLAVVGANENLSEGEIHDTMDEIMKDFKEGPAVMTYWGSQIQTNVFDKLEGLNKKELYTELDKLPGTMALIAEKAADGVITWNDYQEIMKMYAQESQNAAEGTEDNNLAVDEAIEKYGDFADEVNASAEANRAMQLEIQALWKFATELFADMADQFKEDVNLMIRLAGDMKNDIIDEFDDLLSDAEDKFADISAAWKKEVNYMIRLAADAKNDINDQLDGIKDKTVNITFKKNTVTAQGGFHSPSLPEDTVIFAHKGEKVNIGPGSPGGAMGPAGHSGSGGGSGGAGKIEATFIIQFPWGEIVKHMDLELGRAFRGYIP